MRINVKLYATLRRFAPKDTELGDSFPIELKEGTIKEVLSLLQIPSEYAKIIMLNGIQISTLETKLSENDLLVIFPPIGGGQNILFL